MSFNVVSNTTVNSYSDATVQFESLEGEDYPCRWRTYTYRNGVLVGCSEWTYGECIKVEIQ